MLHEIDLSRADLNLLVVFEAVMAEGHVGRAAGRLHLSPSAVSHGLRRLRDMLGDPLFLRTPKGVQPSDRAMQLAGPIAEILARVRGVVASAEPFDPARSTRRFTIGAPDGASLVFLPLVFDHLRRAAPHVDLRVRQLLPKPGEASAELAWREALADLEGRTLDIAVIPSSVVPVRFLARTLYEEDFVVAMRARHPFASDPSLKLYLAQRHIVVSQTGDEKGFVDTALADQHLSRRVTVTAPNFMFALAMIAETDLIGVLPRQFAAMHGARFNVVVRESPIRLPRFSLTLVTPKVAMDDAGLAWLVHQIERVCAPLRRSKRGRGEHQPRVARIQGRPTASSAPK
jgi:DNA-binding transcriptional LysR family regulator